MDNRVFNSCTFWCIITIATDIVDVGDVVDGVVYATNEDGIVYATNGGGVAGVDIVETDEADDVITGKFFVGTKTLLLIFYLVY